ncbi:MAG: hypothetical protein SVP26_08105 [Chloroflexota bacterium]|nr:hypothetical protein [Chloroflexota bacterium]
MIGDRTREALNLLCYNGATLDRIGGAMEFARRTKTTEFLVPSRQFGSEVQTIEYRLDPLTGSEARLNLRRARRVKQAQRTGADLSLVLEGSKADCFFCPENMESQTPEFPPALSPEGRIRKGECVVFPNLFPFARYHAVGTLTARHYLDLDEFTPEMLSNNLAATREYLARVHGLNPGTRYPMWIWNHMPPSGASVIHPHVQIVVDCSPAPEVERVLQGGEQYLRTHGVSYWDDLVGRERELGERYIGENESLVVLASYAPRGNRDVQLVFKNASGIAGLDEKQTTDFSKAIVQVLRGYKEMGVDSFNLVTYSGPIGEELPYHRLSARVISRPGFHPFYTSDCGFMERFFDVWVIESLPEDVAKGMRHLF